MQTTGPMMPLLPRTKAGREIAQALLPGEQVLAWAEGQGRAICAVTDRRVLIAKVGAAATGQWFGRKLSSFAWSQITGVDLHMGALDGHLEIGTAGTQQLRRGVGFGSNLPFVRAPNACAFLRKQEAAFRRVAAVIQERLYPSMPH